MCQTLCKVTVDRHRDEKSPCSRNICFVYLEEDLHMNKSNIRRHLLTTKVMEKKLEHVEGSEAGEQQGKRQISLKK